MQHRIIFIHGLNGTSADAELYFHVSMVRYTHSYLIFGFSYSVKERKKKENSGHVISYLIRLQQRYWHFLSLFYKSGIKVIAK